MIATIAVKVNAAKPNFPLQPMFAFQGSPSSIRILDVPKSIGNWAITSVKVAVTYPDNTTVEKVAVRNGSVWVSTIEGCDIAGKVANGYEVLADGKDEDGNDVTGYVLGKGDVFIIEDSIELSRLIGKIAVRYMDEIPDVPTKGDLMNSNGELRLFDGQDWLVISTTEPPPVYDSQITIKKNGTPVGTFTVNADQPKAVDIPVPSNTSDIVNDSGFITVDAIPSDISAFNNDVGYITEAAIPSQVTAFENDAGYITSAALPTKVSELENDSGFITEAAIPSNISSFNNDSGYITENAIPSTVGAFQNDVGYLTSVSWGAVLDKPDVALLSDIPSKVSELDNDEGFITADALPSKVSELENDAGYITASAIPAVPSNVSDFNNDVGYLTASSSTITNLENDVSAISGRLGEVAASVETLGISVSSLTASMSGKRDKTDLVYKVGFDKDNLDKVVKFVVEYVDGNNQNVTATLDKYDEFTQTWTGDNTNWRVYTYLVGMEAELYFEISDGTSGQDGQPAPSQGAEDTSWNFTYNGNPATWTMVMTQNIALQQDFKNLRDMKDISYPASVDSTGMYTIKKFNVNGTEVAHFTTSGSTSTWDTNDPSVNIYEISTTDGTNFTLVSGGIQLGTFTMTNLKNGVVDVTYDGNTYTVGAVFKQTTFALKDYVDEHVTSIPSATSDLVNDSGFITASAIPSNVGAFTNDAGYLTATSTTITNLENNYSKHEQRLRVTEKDATGAREYMDLSYPTVNADAQDGFGIDGFHVVFPSYNDKPRDAMYLSFYAVVSGSAVWHNSNDTIKVMTSDGIHFTYNNNGSWSELPVNANGTEAWTHYYAQGIRPAYVTPVFKSSAMKEIALKDYVNAQIASAVPSQVSELQNDAGYITASAIPAIPSKTSELDNDSGFITVSAIPSNISSFNNDVGYLTASDVSTSALYPSASYSAYVQIDDYGEVNAKKLVNETGVWFIKAVMEQYTTDPVTGYWVSPPKITDNGTNLIVEFCVQDKERNYQAQKITYDAASSSATELLIAVTYNNVGFRVWLKKSTQADIPLWVDCGRLVRDGDANTGLRMSQILDDIGLVRDISQKRDLTDISYPASVDSTGMYTISQFTVDGVSYDVFGTGYPSTGNSYWTDDGEQHTNCVWTSNGTNYQLRLSGTDFGSTFTFSQLKSSSVVVTSSGVSHRVIATFKQTTFALKDYVDAQIGNVLNEQF